MGSINTGRFTAEIEGDFVVFIIGARPTPWRLIRGLRDLGGRRGMKFMLDYLMEHPEKGLLGYEQFGIGAWVQYWRSFDHLEAFAKDADDPHLKPWRNYFKRVGSSGRTGIWHETFSCATESSRRSTPTCPTTASPRHRGWCRWPTLSAPAAG